MKKARQKVVVAVSGGVDSSVAAALLLRQGYDVVGAFMKNWSDESAIGPCSWRTERDDARRVAARLGIELLTFDLEKEYRESVYEYLIREYAAGRTPNPDVLCNQLVKFGPFLREALKLGADMIATGHYARVERAEAGDYRLLAGVDAGKDQSYFLHRLGQEQLARTLFPVGGMIKPEVRRLAREFGLSTAEKKDSQGICFIGQVALPAFLVGRIPSRPGPIVTVGGRVVGRHEGLAPFTIGQRHGFKVSGGRPYFVVEKDMRRNTLVIASGDDPELLSPALRAEDVHWITGEAPELPLACRARIRYRQPLQEAAVEASDEGRLFVRFAVPQRAVTPGQFVVFYEGELCLGGAVIAEGLEGVEVRIT